MTGNDPIAAALSDCTHSSIHSMKRGYLLPHVRNALSSMKSIDHEGLLGMATTWDASGARNPARIRRWGYIISKDFTAHSSESFPARRMSVPDDSRSHVRIEQNGGGAQCKAECSVEQDPLECEPWTMDQRVPTLNPKRQREQRSSPLVGVAGARCEYARLRSDRCLERKYDPLRTQDDPAVTPWCSFTRLRFPGSGRRRLLPRARPPLLRCRRAPASFMRRC